MVHAEKHLNHLISKLLAGGIEAGVIHNNVPAHELASYCLHALTAASKMPSYTAVHRLVEIVLGALVR